MKTKNNTVLKITAGKVSEPAKFELIADKKIVECDYQILDAEKSVVAKGIEKLDGNNVSFNATFDAISWSVNQPYMYIAELEIIFEDATSEKIIDRFAFRYMTADDKYLYLNGYPFYMRGYIRGCTAHEHSNNCNLSEYDFYKKNILTAKSFGYNTIRFHSTIPPKACFDAADDCGILIHIEMRAENEEYDNLEEMVNGRDEFIDDASVLEVIHDLYNHPSFMVYCVGNEIRKPGTRPRIREIRDFIKKHDPTRLFIDTCAHGEFDRDYVDFDIQHMGYFFPYDKHADMFENTDNLLGYGSIKPRQMKIDNGKSILRRGIKFDKPMLAHEVLHYCSWRDFYALKEKFIKYNRPLPWWIDEEIKMIEAKGYDKNFKETLQITKDFQFRCWKTALENLRSSPLLSGFHMLQFADNDRFENSNGVVDCFDDPHGISPEQFYQFNSDTVLLARLPKQIYSFGENVTIPVLLSQFKINPPKTGDFSFEIKENDKVVIDGVMPDVDTFTSGLYRICSIETNIPKFNVPTKLTLTCSIKFIDGTITKNDWEFWAFPPVEEELLVDAKADLKDDYLNSVCKFTGNDNMIITDKLDDNLFEKLDQGKDVLFIYRTDWTRHLLHKDMKAPKYSFRHTWGRYKGLIWDRGTINGGPDRKDILNKFGFVSDGQLNYQYYHLIDDSDKITLDDFPAKVSSIVSCLDKSSRDRFDPTKFKLPELMYDRTMRNFTYAFTLGVGKGRLLVTGFNFTKIKSNPAVMAMFKTLVNYFKSNEVEIKETISTEKLQNYLMSVAQEGPQREGMMTQYWQLDAEPVESLEYWIEAERYINEDFERHRTDIFRKIRY